MQVLDNPGRSFGPVVSAFCVYVGEFIKCTECTACNNKTLRSINEDDLGYNCDIPYEYVGFPAYTGVVMKSCVICDITLYIPFKFPRRYRSNGLID